MKTFLSKPFAVTAGTVLVDGGIIGKRYENLRIFISLIFFVKDLDKFPLV